MMVPTVIVGRIQPSRLWKPCAMRVPGFKNVVKSFAKGRNMQYPTILAVVGQRCWVRLHGANVAVNARYML